MARIAIVGGHGRVGSHLARMLSADGHEVRSLFRDPRQLDEVSRTGATPVVADVENLDLDELAALFVRCDAVVWSAGAGGGDPSRTYAVDRDAAIRSMDAAQEAGVPRYVMISYFGARTDHGIPEGHPMFAYAEAKAAADNYLRKTALSWTILAPSTLTFDPGTGLIEAGPGLTPTTVTREDVARVAASVLDRPETVQMFIPFNNGRTPIEDALDWLSTRHF
jgi:uncharacterized protein YbjT (DUF2867 family)